MGFESVAAFHTTGQTGMSGSFSAGASSTIIVAVMADFESGVTPPDPTVTYGSDGLTGQRSNLRPKNLLYTYSGLGLGTGSAKTVSADFGTTALDEIVVLAISYSAVNSIEVVTGGNLSGSDSTPTNTFTPTTGNTYVNFQGNRVADALSGSHTVRENHSGALLGWGAQDVVLTTAAAITMSWTLPASGDWVCQTIGLAPVAGGDDLIELEVARQTYDQPVYQ